jgi:hypothetical protein
MSILFSLRRFVDGNQFREEEEERRRAREVVPPDVSPDAVDVPVLPPRATAARAMRCRVCGLEGDQQTFCPVCLAATMVPSAPREG